MANFIVQFPLKTEKYQEDILDKRFEIGRQIYNSLVNVTQKRYKEMIKTKNYRNLMSKLSGENKINTCPGFEHVFCNLTDFSDPAFRSFNLARLNACDCIIKFGYNFTSFFHA